MISTVIFDMDGLLIDSEPLWDKTDTTLLNELGHTFSPALRARLHGTGQRECYAILRETCGITLSFDEYVKRRWDLLYALFDQELNLMPHVREIISYCVAQKLILAVATGGHTAQKAREILARFDIAQNFDVIISSQEVQRGKPAPDIFLEAARRLGVDPAACIVLEDAHSGVSAARAAGMRVIGVNNNAIFRNTLHEAQWVVRDLLEAQKIIDSLLKKSQI